MLACTHVYCSMCMEVRDQLMETSSLLPLCVLRTEAKLPGLYIQALLLLGHLTGYLFSFEIRFCYVAVDGQELTM